MAIWILTIGNSDIALESKDTWDSDFTNTSAYQEYALYGMEATEIPGKYGTYTAPARVVGELYTPLLEDDDEDFRDTALAKLTFPLIDNYHNILQSKGVKLDDIYILLSNQFDFFNESQRRSDNSPYWKDTVTLWPVLRHKLTALFPECKLKDVVLKPSEQGLDHWDATLTLLKQQIKLLDIPTDMDIYVSHQAGTPAMSSALQFVCIALFGSKVKFLVSNEYTEEPDLIQSSKYLKGIKIEQAKQLIKQGEPGAALALLKVKDLKDEDEEESKAEDKLRSVLERLQDLVNLFNAKAVDNLNDDELDVKNAAARIKDTLDIVGLLFENEKYVLGIAILESAHETFVKASVIHTWENIKKESSHKFPISFGQDKEGKNIKLNKRTEMQIGDELSWKDEGVMWYQGVDKSGEKQGERLHNRFQTYSIFKALECAEKLDFWLVFQVIFKEAPNPQSKEIRNQFMHNLRGITKEDVILYLSGQPEKNRDDSIRSIYQEKVVIPFHQALKTMGLWDAANLDDRPSIEARLKNLVQDLDDLA